ncbi:hypothetical protein [Vibrio diazotrophicus]|uniref:hypothetical protein n=1 Tax=Vibrio diazotrophicus TaxID=685 RepID=UPI000C9E9912|nr:hypothetical protein [Vibrio diazotrophicus]PNH94625.1 hypothetical protein C1M59_00880 [Vibrio diazotrophicus]
MKIIIPSHKRTNFELLSQSIDPHYANCVVTIVTDKAEKSITFVTGEYPLCSQFTFVADERSTHIKDKQFSIDGSFTKQIINYFGKEQDIELNFESTNSGRMYVQLFDSTSLSIDEYQNPALRRCQCGDVLDKHLTYLLDNQQRPTTTTSKALMERILYEAKDHLPFEFIELDKDNQYIRVQRQGEIEDKSLPNDLKLPLSLVLTPETTQQMTELCQITSGSEIEIAQQGEALTFKTPECTLTCSLAGVEEFYRKKPDPIVTLLYFIVNLFTLKGELEHCISKYNLIKKANEAFLYLSKDKAAIAFLTEPYEFVHPIHVFEVGSGDSKSGLLLRFSPKDLKDMKIKNSLEARKTRLNIFKTSRGELKLGVYYSLEDKLPYTTIAVEESDIHLKKVLAMIESIEENLGDKTFGSIEQQSDLFGFGDSSDA